MELAFKFHQEGRLGDAERLYREVLRTKPRDFEALHMLGILKLQQNQPDDAVRLISVALEVDRTSVAAHSNYGLALNALGRHAEALVSFIQYVQRDSEQYHSVHDSRQNLNAVITISPFRCRRPFSEPDGKERQPQPGNIGQHMPCICEQCKAVGENTADDFRNQIGEREAENQHQFFLIA